MTWCAGLPDTSGAAAYTVLIRAAHDEDGLEIQGHGFHSGRETTGWKRLNDRTPHDWANHILRLLADERERTFNRICLELTGGWYHADQASGTNLKAGLWLAVEHRRIYWRNPEDGEHGIRFAIGREGDPGAEQTTLF